MVNSLKFSALFISSSLIHRIYFCSTFKTSSVVSEFTTTGTKYRFFILFSIKACYLTFPGFCLQLQELLPFLIIHYPCSVFKLQAHLTDRLFY